MEELQPLKNGRDSVLDFWRGISILLVIGSHLASFRLYPLLKELAGQWSHGGAGARLASAGINQTLTVAWYAGGIGVKAFLVISGYLITKTLIEELGRTGKISLWRFYVRRFWRIVPANATYLLCIGAFIALGWVAADRSQIPCMLFLANTSASECEWNFLHLWSLSVEEQFYAIWPIFLLIVPAVRRTPVIAAICVVFAGFSALKIWFFYDWIDNGWAFASVAAGALFAVSPLLRRYVTAPDTRITGLSAIIIALILTGATKTDWIPARFAYALVSQFAILRLIAATRRMPHLLVSRTFSITKNAGLMSYSLYLWQQPFTNSPMLYPNLSPLLHPWLMVPCALASYFAVEKPLIRWSRARFGGKDTIFLCG